MSAVAPDPSLDRCSTGCATRTAAIVLNYRTPELTIECVRSLAPQIDARLDRLTVVDNRSGDGSVERIQAALAEGGVAAEILETPRNGGFAYGHNFAITAVAAETYLLVNSDTRFLPGAVERLRARLATDARIGVVSPRLEDPDGTPQVSCFRFHTPWSEMIYGSATDPVRRLLHRWDVPLSVRDAPEEPPWTSFACVLVRAEALSAVGSLDPGFFMYFEDVDLCRRLWRGGWKVASEPSARVVHLGSASTRVDALEEQRERRPRYFYASRSRYFRKHFGASGLFAANVMWTAGRTLALLREVFGSKAKHTVQHELLDRWRG